MRRLFIDRLTGGRYHAGQYPVVLFSRLTKVPA